MPQLIAMVIVVVGAMIYMFQTFGGTGDKIEGVAQKNSVITEINNIKQGLIAASKEDAIIQTINTAGKYPDAVNTLEGLAFYGYFAEQINEQINENGGDATKINVYNAISFGGNGEGTINATAETNKSALKLSLVVLKDHVPGIYVNLADGPLKDNAAFLESSLSNDLKAIATIDRLAVSDSAAGNSTAAATDPETEKRTPALTTGGAGTNNDGKFIIYFKDFSSSQVVK